MTRAGAIPRPGPESKSWPGLANARPARRWARPWRVVALLWALLALGALSCAVPGGARGHSPSPPGKQPFSSTELEPLLASLESLGFDRKRIEEVFYDRRLRKIDRVVAFNAMNPDSERLYSQFITPYAIRLARRFRRGHREELQKIEDAYGVPKEIITGILLVETRFGGIKLPYRVLEVFTTLAVESHPSAVERHFDLLKVRHPEIEKEWLASRLVKKANFALVELVAALSMFKENLKQLYEVRGSYAGAIGIPQFLPSSYLRWSVDGDGDGRVDLNNLSDSMASVANFLRFHGWNPEAPLRTKWRAIWEYNHSDHYVRTMFEIAFRLSNPRRRKNLPS